MRAVYKFELPYTDGVVKDISLPVGAEILHVAMQHGTPMMWALVKPYELEVTRTMEERRFRIVGTGHAEVRDGSVHIGSVLDNGFVWHFFEEVLL